MKTKGSIWIGLGLLLVVAALFLVGYNVYDNHRAEQVAGENAERLIEKIEQTDASEQLQEDPSEPEMEMPIETIDGVEYIGVMRIPLLGLELPVIRDWSASHLRISPCRYKGSAYTGDFIIAGHNYSSHFANLKTLQPGDVVTFTDVEGTIFSYEVVELEVLKETLVEEMECGAWNLTLFTCTASGRSRVAIRCEEQGR